MLLLPITSSPRTEPSFHADLTLSLIHSVLCSWSGKGSKTPGLLLLQPSGWALVTASSRIGPEWQHKDLPWHEQAIGRAPFTPELMPQPLCSDSMRPSTGGGRPELSKGWKSQRACPFLHGQGQRGGEGLARRAAQL